MYISKTRVERKRKFLAIRANLSARYNCWSTLASGLIDIPYHNIYTRGFLPWCTIAVRRFRTFFLRQKTSRRVCYSTGFAHFCVCIIRLRRSIVLFQNDFLYRPSESLRFGKKLLGMLFLTSELFLQSKAVA